jgi:hypothetical protein
MGFREDIRDFNNALGLAVKDATSSKTMRAYGEAAIKVIIARTRLGFGVKKTGSRKFRLAKLQKSTIRKRRTAKNLNTSLTSPSKSNLTFTGRLLNSLLVKKASPGRVIVGPSRRRRKGGLTNEEISAILEKGNSSRNLRARPYLALSTKELRDLNRQFSLSFDKALKRRL